MEVPESDDLPPLRELVATALKNRPDVLIDKINNESQEISALGTANAILPSLTGSAYTLNRGSAGSVNPIAPVSAGAVANRRAWGPRWARSSPHDTPPASRRLSFQRAAAESGCPGRYGDRSVAACVRAICTERKNRNDMVVAISNQMIGAAGRLACGIAMRWLRANCSRICSKRNSRNSGWEAPPSIW